MCYNHPVALAGDTLFALGCGRLFEGDPQTMWTSLSKLKVLPGSTRVYCAHEYTQSNARFAVSVDPNNQQLQERSKAIDAARQQVGWGDGLGKGDGNNLVIKHVAEWRLTAVFVNPRTWLDCACTMLAGQLRVPHQCTSTGTLW